MLGAWGHPELTCRAAPSLGGSLGWGWDGAAVGMGMGWGRDREGDWDGMGWGGVGWGCLSSGCWLRSPPKPRPPRCVCAHSGWILVLSSTKLRPAGAEGSRAQISGRAVTSSVCGELACRGHGHGQRDGASISVMCAFSHRMVKFADTWYLTSDFQQRWWLSCFLLFLFHTLHLQTLPHSGSQLR